MPIMPCSPMAAAGGVPRHRPPRGERRAGAGRTHGTARPCSRAPPCFPAGTLQVEVVPTSEREADGRRVPAVVHVTGSYPAPGRVLVHDRALLGIVEVVHLQADLHVVAEPVEDRTIQLAVIVAVHRQLPGDAAVAAVVAVRPDRQQVLAAPVVGEPDLPRALL